jgi:ClpP class serine protease
LKEDEDLFTGEVWTGARAVEVGLVDGLGTPRGVLTERFPDAELTPVEGRKPLLARLGLGAPAAARSLAGVDSMLGVAQAADIRATWARYGL